MATVGTFNVALVASTSRFITAISKADRTWNKFARNIQRQAKQMPKAIQAATPASLAMARAVTRAAAVAGAALSGLGLWGIRLAAQFEQSQVAFETMLGSAEEADRFLRELEKKARKTPFGFMQLQDMARQMLAWGFGRQEVEEMIDPIGNFAAAMGKGQETIERVVRALGQMRARAKVSAEEMMQLAEAGVPAWELLAKAMGTSIPEAMDRVRKGTVSATTGIRAIIQGLATDQRFANAMQRQANTMLGQWEQIKDGMSTITRGMGEDIIRIFGVASAMRSLNAAIGRFADLVSDYGFIGALSRAFPPWVTVVIVAIAGAITGALVPAIASWLIPILKKLRTSLIATLKPLWPWMVVGAAVAATVYLLARYWGQLPAIARAAWGAVSAVVLYAASLVVRGVAVIISAIAFFIPSLRGAAQAVHGLADSLKVAAGQSLAVARSAVRSSAGVQNATKSAQKTAQTAQQAAQAQENLGDAMEKAAKSAQDNLQSFDEVHTIQEQIGSAAGMAAGAIQMPDVAVPGVPDVAGDVGGGIAAMGEQTSKIAEIAAAAWERLKQAMEPVNRAVQWIKDNWPTIGPIVEGIAGVLMVLLIPALIRTGVQAVLNGAKVLASFAMMAAGAIAHGATIVGQILLQIGKWVLLGIQATVNAAKVVVAWAIQGWQAVASGAVQVGQFVLLLGRWAMLGAQAMLNGAKVVAAWLMQLAPAAAAAGAAVAHGAIIVAQWVLMGVQSLANAAKMAAAWFIALGPIGWVIATVIALAVLIIAKWDWIKEKTAYIWNIVSTWISNTWDSIKNKATNIFNKVRDTIANAFNNVKTKITNIWNSIYTWVTSKWTNINNTAVNTFNRIKNSIIDAFNNVKTRVSTIWNNIWSSIKNFINKIISGINTMIRGMNKLKWNAPSWVPVIGGKSWGINIPTIPYLATGTNYVPQDMVAYLHEGEAVVPKKFNPAVAGNEADADAIAQAVYRAIMDAFRIIRASSPKSDSEDIVLKLDSKELARLMLPALTRESQRRGYNLVLRGV